MSAAPQNLLVIMSDEHNKKLLGHLGHPVATPSLDALAGQKVQSFSSSKGKWQ
jgi:choline-sulfatase